MVDANGKEILNEVQFYNFISSKPDRALLEFVAKQAYTQSCQIEVINKDLKTTKTRGIINRFAIIALVLVLIALGIINGSLLPFLVLSPLAFLF